MAEERHDRFTEIEDRYAGYQVYDRDYEKIGKIDDLFVDEYDEPEYIGIKLGFLGTRSTLIPFDLVRINDERELAEVASDKETVKNGPSFDDDQEISPEFEEQVHRYYGLEFSGGTQETTGSGYAAYHSGSSEDSNVDTEYGERAGERTETGEYAEQDRYLDDRERTAGDAGPGMAMGDREGGEFREHPPEEEGVGERESDLEDEDELRVGRTEEELRASKREREAGGVNVRKRVRTDRERMSVPKKHEEVKVDRVPVEGEASESEIGEDEVRMPVTEEEVEVTKRPVQKEEIRIRKETVEEEEVIEEDVRKEEVDVDDDSRRR